jgi:hypothetical protein
LDDGGGLIRFLEGRHGKALLSEFPHGLNTNRPDAFAAATFTYSAATLPAPAYATDYTMLTVGVNQFPFTGRRRSGSLALFGYNTFPVLVEPSGNRLVMEAAGKYNDDPNGGRCVAFTQAEWGRYGRDARGVLFENAVGWTSRKIDPATITIGMGPMLNTNYFVERGYQVVLLPTQFDSITTNLPACDVIAVDWNAPYDDAVVAQIAQFVAQGGGLVVTMNPWLLAHEGVKPAMGQINGLIQPYGLAYRPSTEIPTDLNFTNVLQQAYPVYFSAYPAAQLLGEDHLGQIQLDSLQRVIALNAINSAVNVRPDLMDELTAMSAGLTNFASGSVPSTGASSFVNLVDLVGSQAFTNWLGNWTIDGNDIVSASRRGVLEYDFNTASADLYRLEIDGMQNLPYSRLTNIDLVISVDGVRLGHQTLSAPTGTVGALYVFTPYLPAGAHAIRIFWDNPATSSSLRLKAVHVQSGLGPDSNGNGVKDWVEQFVGQQSGMDLTNANSTSYVSPVCLEGRDPYPSLMQVSVQGSQSIVPVVRPAPNKRWYFNARLSRDQNTPLVLNVSYQNGAISEWHQIQWLPTNVFGGGSPTVRQGDSLLLLAQPPGATNANMQIIVGTNQLPVQASAVPYQFTQPGTYTVTGIYKPSSLHPQSASMTVNVIGYQFPLNPDAWMLNERTWDLTNVPPQAAFDSDSRMLFEVSAPLTNGYRANLIADQNEPRYVLSRLGAGGSIFDSAKVNGFQFWSSEQTYTKLLQTYPDGSQLVETLMIMSPMPADVTVRMDVIVGGVIFTDGTTSKAFSASDFDNLGRCAVQFIRPASAKTSVCHSIKLFQGSQIIGTVQ